MQATDGSTHVASIKIDASAEEAFAFMRDARNISQWALGAYSRVDATFDTHAGDSIIDGERIYIKVESDHAHMIIHFSTGPAWDRLKPLMLCRVVPGALLDISHRSCQLSMIAWRPASMELQRWQQRCATHEAEMFLIRNRIEASVPLKADSLSAAQ